MYDARSDARARYNTAKKDHKNLRAKFIKTFTPKDRDRIQRTEAQRALGRAAKLVTGKLASKSVTKVKINGQECTSKEAIEATLIEVNSNKIRACEDTPFLQEPLYSWLGPRNDTPVSDTVLTGTAQPPENIDPHARALLDLLHLLDIPPNDPKTYHPRHYISTSDHINGWQKAKEQTSAGLSGIHFGMFKANITRRALADLDASMQSIAYTTGFSYRRWK